MKPLRKPSTAKIVYRIKEILRLIKKNQSWQKIELEVVNISLHVFSPTADKILGGLLTWGQGHLVKYSHSYNRQSWLAPVKLLITHNAPVLPGHSPPPVLCPAWRRKRGCESVTFLHLKKKKKINNKLSSVHSSPPSSSFLLAPHWRFHCSFHSLFLSLKNFKKSKWKKPNRASAWDFFLNNVKPATSTVLKPEDIKKWTWPNNVPSSKLNQFCLLDVWKQFPVSCF